MPTGHHPAASLRDRTNTITTIPATNTHNEQSRGLCGDSGLGSLYARAGMCGTRIHREQQQWAHVIEFGGEGGEAGPQPVDDDEQADNADNSGQPRALLHREVRTVRPVVGTLEQPRR